MLSNESSGRRYEPTAAEFYGADIPRNLHVPVNSAVFVHETHTLSSLFSNCPVKINLRVFIGNNLAEFHRTFRSQILYQSLEPSGKSVRFYLPNYFSLKTIADYEL